MKKKVILFLCLVGAVFSILSCKKKPKSDLTASQIKRTKSTIESDFAGKTYSAITDGNTFSIRFSEDWNEYSDEEDPYGDWGYFNIEEEFPAKNVKLVTEGACRYNIKIMSLVFVTWERDIYNLQTGEEQEISEDELLHEYDGDWYVGLGSYKALKMENKEKKRKIELALGTPEEVAQAAADAAKKAEESKASAPATKPAEATKPYVEALIDYCNKGISDPWNEDILKNIEDLARKLGNGNYGNSTYGVGSDDPNKILDTWIELETTHIAFLSAAPHFKLTYTEKATAIKASDLDTTVRMIRFKPSFKFTEDFVGKKELESAYKKLQNSNFVMAAAVREYGKNKPLSSPQSQRNVKDNPNTNDFANPFDAKHNLSRTTVMRGTPEFEYEQVNISDTKLTAKGALSTIKNIGKGMSKVLTACYHVSLSEVEWKYPNIKKGWYKWQPAVQVAVADKDGNVLSKWSWWQPKDGFELCVPMADSYKADHYVFSKTWIWYDDSNVTAHGYIDDEFTVPASQIVKR